MDLALAVAGLLVVAGAWAHYFWLISRGAVPRRPMFDSLLFAIGIALAIAAAVWSPAHARGPMLVPIAFLPISTGTALMFFWLWSRSAIPDSRPSFAVGGPAPRVQAWDHRGEAFDSASSSGQRVLLKFFRGHW